MPVGQGVATVGLGPGLSSQGISGELSKEGLPQRVAADAKPLEDQDMNPFLLPKEHEQEVFCSNQFTTKSACDLLCLPKDVVDLRSRTDPFEG